MEASKNLHNDVFHRYLPIGSFKFATCLADLKYQLAKINANGSPMKKKITQKGPIMIKPTQFQIP